MTCHVFWGPHCDQYAWMGVLEQGEVRGGQNNALMVAGDRVWAHSNDRGNRKHNHSSNNQAKKKPKKEKGTKPTTRNT